MTQRKVCVVDFFGNWYKREIRNRPKSQRSSFIHFVLKLISANHDHVLVLAIQ